MNCITILKNLGNRQDRYTEEECYQLWEMLEYQKAVLMQFDINTLTVLVEIFAKAYWDSDKAISAKPLHNLLLSLEKNKQTQMIPKLIEKSMSYPPYVFWAKEMLDKLDDLEKHQLELPNLGWTSNTDYTIVSAAEMAYRQRYNLRCVDKCSRPCQIEDLKCFEIWLSMVSETNSSCLFFNG